MDVEEILVYNEKYQILQSEISKLNLRNLNN